jgi:hypothetical protein
LDGVTFKKALKTLAVFVALVVSFTFLGERVLANELTVYDSRYGVCAHLPSPKALESMVAAGISWARVDFNWNLIEPNPGQWDFRVTDSVYNKAQELGIKLYPSIGYTPAWANGGSSNKHHPPLRTKDWKNFVRKVVERYPEIKHWGIWNEPDLERFFAVPGSSEDRAVKYVSDIYLPAFEVIDDIRKARDKKDLKIIGPEISESHAFLSYFLENVGQKVDIISVHAYKSGGDSVTTIINKVHDYHETVKRYLPDAPIWLGETGWQVRDFGEETQANNLEEFLTKTECFGFLEKVFIYHFEGDPLDYGLTYFDRQINKLLTKPAYHRYQEYILSLDAKLVWQNWPNQIKIGHSYDVEFLIENTGQKRWTYEDKVELALTEFAGWYVIESSDMRLNQHEVIRPGDTRLFQMRIKIPDGSGYYPAPPTGPAQVTWRMKKKLNKYDVNSRYFGPTFTWRVQIYESAVTRRATSRASHSN